MIAILKRSLDWDKHILRNLPVWLRSGVAFTDYLKVLYSAFKAHNITLVSFRENLFNDYKGSGQIVVLEKILNDRFGSDSSRIRIVNNEEQEVEYYLCKRRQYDPEPIFMLTRGDLDDDTSYVPVFMATRAEMDAEPDPDFRVQVPWNIWCPIEGTGGNMASLLKPILNKYKTAGTRYEVTLLPIF